MPKLPDRKMSETNAGAGARSARTQECRTSAALLGRITRSLIERKQPAGKYPCSFDGRPRRKRSRWKNRGDATRRAERGPTDEDSSASGKPSSRPHVKPLANICAVYVERRQPVSRTNTCLVCGRVYVSVLKREGCRQAGDSIKRLRDQLIFFFLHDQGRPVNYGAGI